MEEAPGPDAHRVLVGTEGGQALPKGEGPERPGVLRGGGQCVEVQLAGMIREACFDEFPDLLLDVVEWKGRRLGCRRVASPGFAILLVEAETSPFRFPLVHQEAGTSPNLTVEPVHAVGGCFAAARHEFLAGGQPAFAAHHPEPPVCDERCEVDAQFPLRGFHHRDRAESLGEGTQCRGVVATRDFVAHRHPTLRLLQCEPALIGEEQGQFLAVIGPSRGLLGAFDQDDPGLLRIEPGERPKVGTQLVVRHEEPLTAGRFVVSLGESSGESAGHELNLADLWLCLWNLLDEFSPPARARRGGDSPSALDPDGVGESVKVRGDLSALLAPESIPREPSPLGEDPLLLVTGGA